MTRTSVLAGDSRSRGLFSGRRSRGVTAARFATGGLVLVLLLFFQLWGLIIGIALLLVVVGCTTDTGAGGTVAGWVADKRRWRHRTRMGFVDFIPVDQRPPDLTADRGRRDPGGTGGRREGVEHLPGLAGRGGRPVLAGIPPRPPRRRLSRRGGGDPLRVSGFQCGRPDPGVARRRVRGPRPGGVRPVDGRVGIQRATGDRDPDPHPGHPGRFRVARDVAAGPARPPGAAGPANRLHHPARATVVVLVRATPLRGGALDRGRPVPGPRPPAGPRPGRLAVVGERRHRIRAPPADRRHVPEGAPPDRAPVGRRAPAFAAPRLAHRPGLRCHPRRLLAPLARRGRVHRDHRRIPRPPRPGLAAARNQLGAPHRADPRRRRWRCGRSTGCGSPPC